MTKQKVIIGALGVLTLALPVLPMSDAQMSVYYDVVTVLALGWAWITLLRQRPVRRATWVLLLAGFTAWAVGDLAWSVENPLLHLDLFPAPSDAAYLAGYGLLVAGALTLARTRRGGRDLTALLDACIVAAGITVPMAVFVIIPAAADSSLSLVGRLTASAYPVADVVLLAMLVRVLSTPGGRSWSFAAVMGALALTLGIDCWWNLLEINGWEDVWHWDDAVWLMPYVLVAAAVADPGMHALVERAPDSHRLPSRRRLAVLALGLGMPSFTLFAAGLTGRPLPWITVSVGGVVMTGLVLARMAGLLDQVREQAVQMAAMARRDELTGAPNRRSWNHELSRACARASETEEPLCVAILDLDHFKRFNDTRGHLDGDRLLREAVAAWTDALPPDALLARYGGEEFAVLLPGCGLSDAAASVERLALLTPSAQTFSAGVARWQAGTDPAEAMAAADAALFEAKRAGRNRVQVAESSRPKDLPDLLRDFTIAVQPVVDAATGRLVAHEALSRFSHARDVAGVYAQAHRDGVGDLLEAEAIRRAVQLPGRPEGTELFVNVSAAAVASDRFWQRLPDDLTGLVFELLEERAALDWHTVGPRIAELRRRGARVAIDDLGAGTGDLARFLTVRPHVVKLDRQLVDGCARDEARVQLLRAVVELAHSSGSLVCAEGVEQDDDLHVLRGLGVDLLQGYLIARPSASWGVPATWQSAMAAGLR